MEFGLIMKQQLGLSRKQVESLQILEMTAPELDELVRSEELENPFFEIDEQAQERERRRQEAAWLDQGVRAPKMVSVEEDAALRQMPAPQEGGLRDALWQQIDWTRHSAEEQRVLRALLLCLDERGFLTDEPVELAALLCTSLYNVRHGLRIIRSLEPAGVGAQDIGHCFALQLQRRGEGDPQVLDAIRYHLEDIVRGRFGVLAKNIKMPVARIKALLPLLRTLNANPVAGYDEGQSGYVVPDAVCTYEADQWVVEINDRWMGSIGLSPYYCRMAHESSDPELAAYAQQKIAHAKFVMSCIEKRRDTLRQVITLVVQQQTSFLLEGGSLQALSMKQIAEMLGIHRSTVSRAVKDKYIQVRRGCFAVCDLLTTAVVHEPGGEVVGRSKVIHMLQEIIQSEDRCHPLSDEILSRRLEERGVRISRRTVAKYRDLLGIAGAFQRKAM